MIKKAYFYFSIGLFLVLTSCSKDEEGKSFEEQLAIDVAVIEDYLTENNINAEVHSSGIRYVVNQEGSGDAASVGDDIAIKFEAYLLDGTLLGSDTIGFTINLGNQLVEAWRLMIPEMNVEGKITFYTPSGYAFGATGSSVIPPNSVLVYEIELLAVIEDAIEQLVVDQNIIDEYLDEEGIDAEVDASGIRFQVLTEGTGASPSTSNEVSVVYAGTFLNGAIFDSGSAELPLADFIQAWRIMVPQMKEGGKLKIYAPSQYCYGPQGSTRVGGIPPNTILVFEISLIEVL